MKFWLPIFLSMALQAKAQDWNLSTRVETISAKENFSNNLLVQSDYLYKFRNLNFFVDGYVEADAAPEKTLAWRRFENGAFLREAYSEFISDSVFVKVGKQSARWSESWVLPSLDVWTSRRYERLFLEPQAYQLNHSTGAIVTLAKQSWSLDVALMWQIARDSFPKPFPHFLEPNEAQSFNGGLRYKLNLGGLQTTYIAAQKLDKNIYGVSANYAFETFVPKIELGTVENNRVDESIINRNLNFFSLGFDLFLNQWTLTPQLTSFENEDPFTETEPQTIYYLAVHYDSQKHGFQLQGFSNSIYNEQFASAEYTYKFQDKWSLTFLIQNYFSSGEADLLSSVYQQTGGTFAGLRLQFNTTLLARN